MSIALLKAGIVTLLAPVDGIGTLDTARIDPDHLPRKLKSTTPYWGLSLAALRDEIAQFGSVEQQFFRRYTLRLEGWRGFSAAADATADWDALVEAVVDRLQATQVTLARSVYGFRTWENLAASEVGVVELRQDAERGYRAHHAVISGEALVFKTLTP